MLGNSKGRYNFPSECQNLSTCCRWNLASGYHTTVSSPSYPDRTSCCKRSKRTMSPTFRLLRREKSKEERKKKWVFLPFLPEINFWCKVIKERLGFNTRFHAVNSSFQVLKFGFLVSGIWVLDYNFNRFLDSLGWALNSKPCDSVFQEKTFTGFWNLDSFAWNDIQRLFKRLEIKRKF